MRISRTVLTSIITIAVLSGLFIPGTFSHAKPCPTALQPEEGIAGVDFLHFQRAIVPCGRKCDDTRTTHYDETQSCTLCHLLILIKNIFDLLFAWLIIIALIFLTISGVLYIISSGNAGLKATAKGIITKTIAGFAVFILSWLIVYTTLVFVAADDDSKLGLQPATDAWFEFTCDPTTSPFN
ncbi:MAG: pilin [Patescibacteria group bacterium]|nr:pilin [Patescibacteria group bacterium]